MRSLLSLFFLFTWAVPIFGQQPPNSLDWKALQSLVEGFNIHDGPNCHNATMIAKGYSAIVSQTSDEELKYYLWNFCSPVNEPPIPGDIFVKTVGAEHEIEHSAVYVGNGKIFEKPSLAGIKGRFSQSPPGVFQGDVKFESTYAIREIEKSEYFNIGKELRRVYRCQPLTEIKSKTAAFERLTDFQVIQEAKRIFANLAFETNPINPDNYQNLPSKIETLSNVLDKLSGREDKDVFLYANAASVWINFANMRAEFTYGYTQPAPLENEYNRLNTSMNSLADRLRATRKNPEMLFILGEPQK